MVSYPLTGEVSLRWVKVATTYTEHNVHILKPTDSLRVLCAHLTSLAYQFSNSIGASTPSALIPPDDVMRGVVNSTINFRPPHLQ